jgi:GT2 family glycosyltransferase
MPVVDVCVVTFNNANSIVRLLRSLERERVPMTVHLWDNGSTDGTGALLAGLKVNSAIRMMVRREHLNIGFPAACNRMLATCSAEVVAIVNPDIELSPGALGKLVDVVRADPTIGVASCRLLTRDGRAQSEPARSRPRLRQLMVGYAPFYLPRHRLPHSRSTGRLYVDSDVQCTSGALMVLRRRLLDELGLLDESVFMYLEDLDFSARVRAAGYRIRYVGTVWAWHDSGVSSAAHQSELFALLPQVWLTYLGRYGRIHERLVVRPVLLAVCLLAALRRTAGGERPLAEIRALRQVLSYRPASAPRW